MSSVAVCFSSLFYDHDCVVLPGFGGFIKRYKASRVHPVSHRAQPPTAVLAFNEKLKENDGLLIQRFASKNQLAADVATEHVRQFVFELQQRIQQGETTSIHGIGRFRLDPEGVLQFLPEQSTDYLLAAYGLPDLQVEAVRKEKPILHVRPSWQHKLDDEIPVTKPAKRIRLNRLIPLVAAVLLLTCLFIPFKKGSSIAGNQWANLFDSTTLWGSQTEVVAVVYESAHLALPEVAMARATVEPEMENIIETGDYTHALVSGAFRDEGNAIRQLNNLRDNGFEPFLLEQGSLHLVLTPVPINADKYDFRNDFIIITKVRGTWIKDIK